jgi:hypothetical protein
MSQIRNPLLNVNFNEDSDPPSDLDMDSASQNDADPESGSTTPDIKRVNQSWHRPCIIFIYDFLWFS